MAKIIFFSRALLLLVLLPCFSFSQEKSTYSFFIEPEFHFGKIVSNYSEFPQSRFTKTFGINIGINDKRKISASKFFNFPSAGIGFLYSDFNNDSILGKSYQVMPFLMFKPFASIQQKWWLKFGLGASYFTKTHSQHNRNLAIGSHVTWSFQAYMYRDLYLNNRADIRLGAGYLHSSNGHTKLPNMGLNSAQLSLAYRWKFNSVKSKRKYANHKANNNKDQNKIKFLNIRNGIGAHEYGGKTGPVGGSNKPVYSFAVSGGLFFHKHIKLRTGFTYRYYQHYFDKISELENSDLNSNPKWNASNIYFHLGCEFLTGHFGLDIEGGLNLFKPYYKIYYSEFWNTDSLKYQLKRHFVSRMGINFYLINTNRMPKNNFFIGANINANFGQADFSELSIGYTYTFD